MIYINNNALPVQPSILQEELIQIQTDQYSINGAIQRNKIGQKQQSTMTFSKLSPTDYQTVLSYVTTGSGIYYYNDQSNYAGGVMAFSGLPFFDEGQYVQGGSLFREIRVRVREI